MSFMSWEAQISHYKMKIGESIILEELSAVFGLRFAPFMIWTLRSSHYEIKLGVCMMLGELSNFL